MIGLPRFAIEGIGVSVIAILAYQLTSQSSESALVVPILGMLALGSQRFLPILQQGYASWTLIRSGKPALVDVINLLESLPIEDLSLQAKIKPFSFQKDILLSNVSFFYKSSTIGVLRNINLRIEKGSRVGIVGATGSGKSTLLDVIMGLMLPTQGSILVDGKELSKFNILNWRKCIAHVPQHVFISDANTMKLSF